MGSIGGGAKSKLISFPETSHACAHTHARTHARTHTHTHTHLDVLFPSAVDTTGPSKCNQYTVLHS